MVEQQAAIVAGVLNSEETLKHLSQLSSTLGASLESVEGPMEALKTAARFSLTTMAVTKDMGASIAKGFGSLDVKQFVEDAELAITDKVRICYSLHSRHSSSSIKLTKRVLRELASKIKEG
jgi:CRISPR/Cas system CMR-associated protein Cmr1 (group 7 of RAMP superfamily)